MGDMQKRNLYFSKKKKKLKHQVKTKVCLLEQCDIQCSQKSPYHFWFTREKKVYSKFEIVFILNVIPHWHPEPFANVLPAAQYLSDKN